MALAQQLRRFLMPPPVIGGPPELTPEELQPTADEGPSPLVPAGPPALTPEQMQDSVAAVTSPMVDMTPQDRANLAQAGLPPGPYRPEPQAMQLPAPPALMQGGPKPVSGLRKALAIGLPIGRDLLAGAAAGSSSPTTIGGAGAGLQEQMALEQHRAGLAAAQHKQRMDEQKLQIEAQKAQAEGDWRSAQAGKARGETSQLPSRLALDQERYRAQAEASRAAAEHNRAQALHERAIAQQFPEKSAAEIKELASRAALHDMEAKKFQEYIAAGVDSATARLRAKEESRAGAQAAYLQKQTETYDRKLEIEGQRAGAYSTNAKAAMMNALARAKAGLVTQRDLLTARNGMRQAIQNASQGEINPNSPAAQARIKARVSEAQKMYGPWLEGGEYWKQAHESGAAGGPPALNPPAASQRPRAKNPQTGEIMEFDGQQWVPAEQ